MIKNYLFKDYLKLLGGKLYSWPVQNIQHNMHKAVRLGILIFARPYYAGSPASL